jgi:hypothetical protein
MNSYIIEFFFIQYPLFFTIMVTCDLTFVTKRILVIYHLRLKFSCKHQSQNPIFLLMSIATTKGKMIMDKW